MASDSTLRKFIYTPEEVAKSFCRCPATIYLVIKQGLLVARRSGRRFDIHYKDLEAFSEYVRNFGFPNVWDKNKPWPVQRPVSKRRTA